MSAINFTLGGIGRLGLLLLYYSRQQNAFYVGWKSLPAKFRLFRQLSKTPESIASTLHELHFHPQINCKMLGIVGYIASYLSVFRIQMWGTLKFPDLETSKRVLGVETRLSKSTQRSRNSSIRLPSHIPKSWTTKIHEPMAPLIVLSCRFSLHREP